MNTRIVEHVSIQPETCAHVRVINQVENSTTANVSVTVHFVAVVEHNRDRTIDSTGVHISTGGVETSGRELHEKVKRNGGLDYLYKVARIAGQRNPCCASSPID